MENQDLNNKKIAEEGLSVAKEIVEEIKNQLPA